MGVQYCQNEHCTYKIALDNTNITSDSITG